MSNEPKRFLDEVYGLDEAPDTKDLYRDWAATYDAELAEQGYVSPQRCAQALKDAAEGARGPLHDLGCGTGLSGEAFAEAGFDPIDGSDFSEEMLKIARDKGVYRDLLKADLNTPLPFEDEAYAHIAAVGVFSPGHAPAELI
ncbi:MAG: class I SAM-dependent DNA methyltransferase, partial [Pseudomonadota bacterium]